MLLRLTFNNTLTVDYGDLTNVIFPDNSVMPERMIEIIRHVIFPFEIDDLSYSREKIFVTVNVPEKKVFSFLNEVAYYLPDEDLFRLKIEALPDVYPVGQDIWAEGDISLDDESKNWLGYPAVLRIDYYPILTDVKTLGRSL